MVSTHVFLGDFSVWEHVCFCAYMYFCVLFLDGFSILFCSSMTYLIWILYCYYIIISSEREIWVGGEMQTIWENLGEGKTVIRIYYIKN